MEKEQRIKDILLDLRDYVQRDPLTDDPEELGWVDEALSLLPEVGRAGKLLVVGCDVVHPDSGEILATEDDTFRLPHPTAERIIAIARAYPPFYLVVENARYIVIADATIVE